MRYFPAIFCLILYCGLLKAQEEHFFYGPNGVPLNSEEKAIERKEVHQRSETRYTLKTFRRMEEKWELALKEKIKLTGSGVLLIRVYRDGIFPEKHFRHMQTTRPGYFRFREMKFDQTLREGVSSSFLPLHLEGDVTEYYPNGALKSRSAFRDNQLVSNENWLPDGTRYIDSIFYSADTEPEYKLGNTVFRRHILQSLADSIGNLQQIQDMVVIGWVVMEDGTLQGVIPLRGKSRQLNQLLANIISALPGSWEPARLNDKPVRYFMSVPINFMQREVMFQDLEFSGGMLHYDAY